MVKYHCKHFDHFRSFNQNLVVCNAGLSTGLKNDVLLMEAMKYGNVLQIILLPGKSYSFMKCKTVDDAISIYSGMNARSKLGQSGSVLYLLYCDDGKFWCVNFEFSIFLFQFGKFSSRHCESME